MLRISSLIRQKFSPAFTQQSNGMLERRAYSAGIFSSSKTCSSRLCRCQTCASNIAVRRNYGLGSFFSQAKSSSSTSPGSNEAESSKPVEESPEPASSGKAAPSNNSSDSTVAADKTLQEMQKLITEKDEKIKTLTDSYRMALADMENLRTRTAKEVENAKHFSIQKFAKDLLDVADVLDMAIASVPEEHRHDSQNPHLRDLFSGLNVTQAELKTIFKRHGIEVFDPVDQPFDPNFHNALFQVPMADKKPNTVVIVQKKGFTLNGRVIRPAAVGVSREP